MHNNNSIKLSIVTAVRNLIESGRENMIRRCIESVIQQDIAGGVEHIISDGASTDGTLELLKKIQQEICVDKDLFRIFSKPDHQVFEGMNNGLLEAHGKYVIFLNSDDYFVGTRELDKSLKLFDKENADVGYADTYLERPGYTYKRRHHSNINKLPFADHFIHQSMVTRTDVMREFGGFDISLKGTCLENDLTMRLLKAGKKFIRSPYCFCSYSLDGMTGRGTGQRSQHPDMFFRHFGMQLGLTLEECMGIRYFAGISNWSEEKCKSVLKKLEVYPEWAAIWRHQIELYFKDGKHVSPPLWYRLKRRIDEYGLRGLMESIIKRV